MEKVRSSDGTTLAFDRLGAGAPLVLYGSETGDWAANSARALTAVLPGSRRQILDGQTHAVAWDVLAPAVRDFLR